MILGVLELSVGLGGIGRYFRGSEWDYAELWWEWAGLAKFSVEGGGIGDTVSTGGLWKHAGLVKASKGEGRIGQNFRGGGRIGRTPNGTGWDWTNFL